MTLKQLIQEISELEEIKLQPPVLIDIGASGEIPTHWKPIASISKCLVFDADDREFDYIEQKKSKFKELIIVNKIVVDKKQGDEKATFYLTKSPFCSSLLPPATESLKCFHYAPLFEVDQEENLDVVELSTTLTDNEIKYVDWLKTDSQGTDLRLIKSLDETIIDSMKAIDIEPGFINAYVGEDTILDCLNYFKTKPHFYLTDFNIKGPLRIRNEKYKGIFKSKLSQKMAHEIVKKVPGWAEISFFKNISDDQKSTLRDYLVSWMIATLKGHHEIGFEIVDYALEKSNSNKLLTKMKSYSKRKLKNQLWIPSNLFTMTTRYLKRKLKAFN